METKEQKPLPALRGYTYDLDTVKAKKEAGKLVCLRIETNYDCNLGCIYCYAPEVKDPTHRLLSFEDHKRIISEAKDMGLESVVILGPGEPMKYEQLKEYIDYLCSQGITPVIFSNLTLITEELAKFFFEHDVTIMGKYDGPREVQDELCGEGTFDRIQKGLQHLLNAGYGQDPDNIRLGLNYVVTQQNLQHVPTFWEEMRARGIFPSVERATIIGAATESMEVSRDQTMEMEETLRCIDKKLGYEWETPHAAMPAHVCNIFDIGTHIRLTGDVCPCPELPPVGSIFKNSLKEILEGPEYAKIRNIRKLIGGKCRDCQFLEKCGGACRSKASQKGGSYITSEDPFCGIR